VKSSNPVLTRLGQAAERERAAGYGQAGQGYYDQPAYGTPYPTGNPFAPAAAQPMTLDDVVVKTVTLLGITGVSAVAAWNLIPAELTGGAWFGAMVIGLVLGLIISFSRMAHPALVIGYAVVEGAFVGLISKAYQSILGYDGIVLQAVVATFGVFFLMAGLYKTRIIRASSRFRRGMIGALAGVFFIMIANLVLSLFGVNTGLRDNGPVGYLFSAVCIVIAALSFVLDFDQIEQGVRMGLPQRYSWTCAFGILVGLIWLYLEILRLLSYLQGSSRD
jgi:uncharacterized YccA/Bax inhibitor family protein